MYDLVSIASTPDLLRLVAVPVLAWAAVRDVKTRRISSAVWVPLSALAAVLFLWEGWVAYGTGGLVWTHEFLIPATMSLGLVVPLAYLFWWFGGFGGADAKALLVLALLFPTVPSYVVGSWSVPLTSGLLSPLSLTILTNAVLVGAIIPIVLALRNAAAGRIAPVMFVGWPTPVDSIPTTHGRLLDTPTGRSRRGLDLDALRMYLRWRGLSLETIRANPERYRDPATLPAEPNPPTDGAVTADVVLVGSSDTDVEADGGDRADAATATGADDTAGEADAARTSTDGALEDPWGAAAFLADIEGTAYGTDAETLRDGLEVLAAEERVWISPGTPFMVPIFLGLVLALTYGDLLLSLLG